jgi:hypothetical protein
LNGNLYQVYGLGVLVFSLGEHIVFVKRTMKSVCYGLVCIGRRRRRRRRRGGGVEEEEERRNEIKMENETEQACKSSSHAPSVFLTVKPSILGTL